MGENLREWALTVCSASVFCAAVSMVIPEEKYEKVINFGMTAMMLLIVLSPLCGLHISDFEISLPKQETAETQSMEYLITRQAAERMEQAAERVLMQKLEEHGITTEEIYVSTDISESGCISICRVTVRLDNVSGAAPPAVKLLLKEWTGCENIDVSGGTDG